LLVVTLPEFIHSRLKPHPAAVAGGWRLWQYKSLNRHRGVIHWDATNLRCTLPDISARVREVVRDHFRPAWWRGFGFGAIVSLNHFDASFEQLPSLIDTINNRRGVWQWIVLHFPAAQSAVGVHTWTQGFLAPVYADLISVLENQGVLCATHNREVHPLIRTLTAIHEKLRVIHLLGAVGGP
jgi:hypothetical protein